MKLTEIFMNLHRILTDKSNLAYAVRFYRFIGTVLKKETKELIIRTWRKSDNLEGFDFGNIPRFWSNLEHQREALKLIEQWVYSRPANLKLLTDFHETSYVVSPIPKEALAIIKKWEGFYENSYICPAGVWTIGYGTTVWLNGKPVRRGEKITERDATDLLETQLIRRYLPPLQRIPYWEQMNSKMRSALLSFAYNLGPFFYGNSGFNSLSTRLRNKEWDRVAKTLELYRNPGSSFEQGLLNRRRDEGNLWNQGLKELR